MLLPFCTQSPSPNHSGRNGAPVLALVLHIEGGTEVATDAWFDQEISQVSAHFSVAKDGTARQFVDTDESAWANGIVDNIDHGYAAAFLAACGLGSPNRFAVSMEHEGVPGDEPSGAQFDAAVRVAAALFGAGGPLAAVPCDREHVLRHSEIGSHPACPSFSEDYIARFIQAVNVALGRVAPVVPPVVVNNVVVPLAYDVLTNAEAIASFMDTVHDYAKFLSEQDGDFIARVTEEFPALAYTQLVNAEAVAAFQTELEHSSRFLANQDQEFIARVTAGSFTPAGKADYLIQIHAPQGYVTFLTRVDA